jgi:hydrogenase-4 component F
VEVAGNHAWLILPLGLGLLVATTAKLGIMQALCLGEAGPDAGKPAAVGAFTLGPMWLHLVLAMLLGIALPGPLAAMLGAAAEIPG